MQEENQKKTQRVLIVDDISITKQRLQWWQGQQDDSRDESDWVGGEYARRVQERKL